MNERVLAHFREQAAFCLEYGSPFTSELVARMADDIEAGGPTATLVAGWATNPRADALSLRLAGALHAAALTARDADLTGAYPGLGREWSMAAVWPLARAFLERERAWVHDFIRSPPQTNETRRSIALLLGFLSFARTWDGPVDILEIGASAGLNLNWDRFAYQTQGWTWGGASSVVIDTDWRGPPPPNVNVHVRRRAACDLNPLDTRDEAARLHLKSYIWPDQLDRLARFDAAASLAVAHDVRVDRASADEWVKTKLNERADDAATIVYHSVFLQYPPKAVRAALIEAICTEGARASAGAPLAWVRLEPEAVTDGVENGLRFVIDLTTWPGGDRRVLGYSDGHVRAVFAN